MSAPLQPHLNRIGVPGPSCASSPATPSPENRSRGRGLGLIPLVCVMYLVVSGGPYGIEDAVGIAGPRLTLLLCIIVPATLSLPTALMAAELTSLMPVEGGFYFWVKEALGSFGGFLEAYLTILYTATDTAIYPVLFTTYLAFMIPIGTTGQIILGITMVWLAGLLNMMGVRPVGNTSIALAGIIIAPFAAMVIAGFPYLIHWSIPAQPLFSKDLFGALGGALTIVIWNFGGWENLSVVAGEIHEPRRNYTRALMIALPAVVLGYLLPLAVSLSGATGGAQWHTGSFTNEGRQIGGPILGAAIAIGGAVSAFALFEAAMLWVSRMPFVLARERYLPKGLTRIWADRATPLPSILLCCVVFTLLVPLGFVTLVVLDVFFYMFALALEMCALVRLRHTRPDRPGMFLAGGGKAGLYAVAIAPLLTWFATFSLAASQNGGKTDFVIAVALALCAWPVYVMLRHLYGGPDETSSSTSAD